MRALVVSNMLPDETHPERGSFVRDQVAALRDIGGLDVELREFAPGPRALATAARRLRARGERFDVVHAHFGLTAWPALAVPARVRALTVHGTDLLHPRTRLATAAVLPRMDLVGAVSPALVRELPGRSARARARVLPCGVDVERFRPRDRRAARSELGLDPERPYVLFPADPARPEKRHDRASELARAVDAELLTLGGVEPRSVPLWINAANAVIVPSEREGFGLAVLEALACGVPVLATPVGIHPDALGGVSGPLCAPFELERWREALASALHGAGPRGAPPLDRRDLAASSGSPAPEPEPPGRAHALRYSARAMAERVAGAWDAALQRSG